MSESNTDTDTGWRELAEQLQAQGGVPPRRAEIVALVATGHSYEDIRQRFDYSGKGAVGETVRRYREEDLEEATWLHEHGPEV